MESSSHEKGEIRLALEAYLEENGLPGPKGVRELCRKFVKERPELFEASTNPVESARSIYYRITKKDRKKKAPKKEVELTVDSVLSKSKEERYQKNIATLKRAVRKVQEEKEEFEREYEDRLNALLNLSADKISFKVNPITDETNKRAVAVIIQTDQHVGERVEYYQTGGTNKHNETIARARCDYFSQKSGKIVKGWGRDWDIQNVVFASLGDSITNWKLHEELTEVMTISQHEEVNLSKELHLSTLHIIRKEIGDELPLTYLGLFGNHGRNTKKIRNSTEWQHSFEYFMHHDLSKILELRDPNIDFIIPQSREAYIDALGWLIRFRHGHSFRYAGGVGGIGIPFAKAIQRWNKIRYADYTIVGHWHQDAYAPGGGIVCSSTMGTNAYSFNLGFNDPPGQRVLLISEDHGLIADHTVRLPILEEFGRRKPA